MFEAKVYKIQIVCLSGLMEETYVAQEVIRKWNQEYAEHTGKLFLPLARDAASNDADAVIGIVGNYIEEPKIIYEIVKAGKTILLLFSKFQDPENTIPSERKAIDDTRKEIESKCICFDFMGKTDFERVLLDAITKI